MKGNVLSHIVILSVVIFPVGGHKSYGNLAELWNYLFQERSYNRYLRPVMNTSTITEIAFGINLVAIVEFSEVAETLTVTAALRLRWKDEFLTWNPKDYGNITEIHVPQNFIWKPYVNVENSVSKLEEMGSSSLQATLLPDGTVGWTPYETFKVLCHIDLYRFPFDTQTCTLMFEVYGMHPHDIWFNPRENKIDLHEYEGTSGWEISSTMVEKVNFHKSWHIMCSLNLRRKSLYFMLNIVWPIIFLCTLNIFAFILPVESGEKVGFVMTTFLSMVVFLTIVSSKLPENSEHLSLLNIYVFVSTLLSTTIAIITMIQIRIYFRDPEIPVPNWLQRFTKFSISLRKIRLFTLNVVEPVLEREAAPAPSKSKLEQTGTGNAAPSRPSSQTAQLNVPLLNVPVISTASSARIPRQVDSNTLSPHIHESSTQACDPSVAKPVSEMKLIVQGIPSRPTFIKSMVDVQRYTTVPSVHQFNVPSEHQQTAVSAVSLAANQSEVVTSDVKWPDVVKAFDNVLFVVFLVSYITFTIALWRGAQVHFIVRSFKKD